jgi:hypothetical protein
VTALAAVTGAVVTLSMLLYFVAVDALVGGAAVAINAWRRRTPDHRQLLGRLGRALPWAVLAVVVLGGAAALVLRMRYGGGFRDVAMPPRFDDDAAVPRTLHLLLAACAVAGVLIARASRRIDPALAPFRRWLARHGALWAMLCTLANLLVGVLWMAALPHETTIRFTGAETQAMLTFSWALIAAILALGFVAMSLTVTDPRRYLDAGSIMLLVTLVGMVRMREALRPALPAEPLGWAAVAGACALMALGVTALLRARGAFARS